MSKRRLWAQHEIEAVRERYNRDGAQQIADDLGRSLMAVYSLAKKLNLAKGQRGPRQVWSTREKEIVRSRYPHEPTQKIADDIGRSLDSVYRLANKLKLAKTEEYLASPDACRLRRGDNIGAQYRFKKGQTPPNKGVKRPGYAPGRMAETQFKKGNATNWMPLGSTRLIDGYVYRKVSDIRNVSHMRNWVPESRLIWEAVNGPMPPGHVLKYVNGDRADNRIENLTLLSRADLARRNSVHNLPPELKKAIHTLGTLKRRIRREEQNRGSTESPVRNTRGPARSGQAAGR